MGSTDIRSHLIGDGKHKSESSLALVEVACRMHGGGRSSSLMIVKPGGKRSATVRGLGLPKELANGRVAQQLAGDERAMVLTSVWRRDRERGRYFLPLPPLICGGEREGWGRPFGSATDASIEPDW
jgi:hypothetical protein